MKIDRFTKFNLIRIRNFALIAATTNYSDTDLILPWAYSILVYVR